MPIRILKKEKKPGGFTSTSQKGNIVKGKLKSQKELKEITSSDEYKKADYQTKNKMLNVATHRAGALVGSQKKLDRNNNNRIDAQDFKILKAEKAKGRGKGLQDEKMKPGKMMKARRGEFIKRRMMLAGKSDGDMSFDAKKRAQDMGIIDKKTGAGRKKFIDKAKSVKLGKKLLLPVAVGVTAIQFLKKKMKEKKENKNKAARPMSKKIPKKMTGGVALMARDRKNQTTGVMPQDRKIQTTGPVLRARDKKMGGGMMNRPMGMQRPMGMMKKGSMVKARGGGMARTKPTKMY